MTDDTWQRIDEHYREFPRSRAEAVSLEEIVAAERKLSANLPKDLVEFIRRYGGGYAGPYLIFGLRRCPKVTRFPRALITEATEQFRADQWPNLDKDWVVISEDHSGNPFCVAPDGKIWRAHHDAGQAELVGRDFEDFLRKVCLLLP